MGIKVIHTKNLRWIDIVSPGEEQLAFLKSNFKFHPLDYADVLTTSEHPKIESRQDDYHFIVLLFPVFDRKSGEIHPAEVDIFVGKNYLITIHDGLMYTMTDVFNKINNNPEERQQFMGKNSGYLLYHILESLFKRSFPILDHINKDMTEIEKNIFKKTDLQMLEGISLMKRNIIDFRRIMKTHHLILKRLMNKKESYLAFIDSKILYSELLDHAENIWDILAIQKETIEALQDANQSLATNQLNQITKVITILSGIFFPATLVLFIFSLHAGGQPFEADPFGFWEILAVAVSASMLILLFFKRRKLF